MATSVSLVTLTVTGVFSILPNRTIAIERPTVDPSKLPVPQNRNTSSLVPIPPLPKENDINEKLLIGLLVGIVVPIVIFIIAMLGLRFSAKRIAKKKGISLSLTSWWTLPKRKHGGTRISEMPAGSEARLPVELPASMPSVVELPIHPALIIPPAESPRSVSRPVKGSAPSPVSPQSDKGFQLGGGEDQPRNRLSTAALDGADDLEPVSPLQPTADSDAPPAYHHHHIAELA